MDIGSNPKAKDANKVKIPADEKVFTTIYSKTTEINISKKYFQNGQFDVNTPFDIIESIFNDLDVHSINTIRQPLTDLLVNYIKKRIKENSFKSDDFKKEFCLNIYNKFDKCGFYNFFASINGAKDLPLCTFELPPVALTRDILEFRTLRTPKYFTVHTNNYNPESETNQQNKEIIQKRIAETPFIEPFFLEKLNYGSPVYGPSESFLRSLCPIATAEQSARQMRYAVATSFFNEDLVPATAFPSGSSEKDYGLLPAATARIEELEKASAVARPFAMPLPAKHVLLSAQLSAAEDLAEFISDDNAATLVTENVDSPLADDITAAPQVAAIAALKALGEHNGVSALSPAAVPIHAALVASGLRPTALWDAAIALHNKYQFPEDTDHIEKAFDALEKVAPHEKYGGGEIPSLWAEVRPALPNTDRDIVLAAISILRLACIKKDIPKALFGGPLGNLEECVALEVTNRIAEAKEAEEEVNMKNKESIKNAIKQSGAMVIWEDLDEAVDAVMKFCGTSTAELSS